MIRRTHVIYGTLCTPYLPNGAIVMDWKRIYLDKSVVGIHFYQDIRFLFLIAAMAIVSVAITFVAAASTFVVFCNKSFDSEEYSHCDYDIYNYFLHSFLFLILFPLVAGRFETYHYAGNFCLNNHHCGQA